MTKTGNNWFGPNRDQSATPFQTAWATGVRAARANRIPAMILWLFGIALITNYFLVAPATQLLDSVGELKTRIGLLFSMVSTGLFGGLIPGLIAWLLHRSTTRNEIATSTLFWAYKGLEIDLFYRLQAFLFGDQLDLQTVAVKTLCDQLVMVPLIGVPNVILFYLFREQGYSWSRFRRALGPGWYRNRVLPVLIANWTIWLPAVVMIYCLPLALQLPVQNLILCFWVLILMFFTDRKLSRPARPGT